MPRSIALLLLFAASWLALPSFGTGIHARAEDAAIPAYWDEKERLPKPDLAGVGRLRFLTTIDFPPFNFLDRDGRLTGFHVELARAICRELGIVPRCQIQGLPWDELDAAIGRGDLSLRSQLTIRKALEERLERARAAQVDDSDTGLLAPFAEGDVAKRWGALDLDRKRAVLKALIDRVTIERATTRGRKIDPDRVKVAWRI